MTISLAKSAQSVQTALDNRGLLCVVKELPASTRTAQEAATSIGCALAQIVKSLIFKNQTTQAPVLVLASGPNRVDEACVAAALGSPIIKADAAFVRAVTGFAIGGIPPIGHLNPITHIFIDESLLAFEAVWAAAGTPNAVFCLKTTDLVAITGGRVIPIQ